MDNTIVHINEELCKEKERLLITLNSIGSALLSIDMDMKITFMNQEAEKMSGWTQDQALQRPLLDVLNITNNTGMVLEKYHNELSRPHVEQDFVLHRRGGGSYDVNCNISPLIARDGSRLGFCLLILDVTETKNLLRRLQYTASHDALTQLENRLSFENHLKRMLQAVQEKEKNYHTLVFVDLDRFKAVNDKAGHAAGDALLCQLSNLMQSMLRPSDVIARLGGDEFGILLSDCDIEKAVFISTRLINAINDYRFEWEGQIYRVGASAGLTLIDERNNQASDVMAQADTACYASKSDGRGTVSIYRPNCDN